jgi:hypothetical protein
LSSRKLDRAAEGLLARTAANVGANRPGPAQLGGRNAVIAVNEQQALVGVEHDDRRGVCARSHVVLDPGCIEMRRRVDLRAREHITDS